MARSIGQGVQFLNRHLSAGMFSGGGPGPHAGEGKAQLFEFLRTLTHRVGPPTVRRVLHPYASASEARRRLYNPGPEAATLSQPLTNACPKHSAPNAPQPTPPRRARA
jgi:hypothetical protein